MGFCVNCGAKLGPNSRFCTTCGKAVPKENDEEVKKKAQEDAHKKRQEEVQRQKDVEAQRAARFGQYRDNPICGKCGTRLGNTRFCTGCGATRPDDPSPNPTAQTMADIEKHIAEQKVKAQARRESLLNPMALINLQKQQAEEQRKREEEYMIRKKREKKKKRSSEKKKRRQRNRKGKNSKENNEKK